MTTTEATVEITLRSSDGLDALEERRFTLHPGAKINVGRASKNSQKPELMVAPNNAFIDSPVISREHAVLSTNDSPPVSTVYIRDNGSMHGTLVNGEKLEPHRAQKLSSGDLLQFGIDVTRNESFYIAHKYIFESSIPEHSFSHGFTVPDSEEEDVDIDVDDLMSSPAPRYGTQTNPVTIEDTEDLQPEVIEIEEEEVAIAREPVVDSDNIGEQAPSPPIPSADDGPAPAPYALTYDRSSEEADDQSIYSSDSEESEVESCASRNDSENNSDVDPLSDADASAEEQYGNTDIFPRMKMTAMLNHEHQRATPHPVSPAAAPSTAPVAMSVMRTPPTVQATLHSEPEYPNLNPYLSPGAMFEDTFGSSMFGNVESPLPPRPAAPKPMNWGSCEYNSSFAPREPNFVYLSPDQSNYASGLYDRFSPSETDTLRFRSDVPPQPQGFSDNPWSSVKSSPSHAAPLPRASGVRTPPPAPTPDTASPPQPRRTKVSIPEIVEDAPPQQPLTPTSVTGSLKRKVEALDEEIAEAEKPSTTLTANAPELPTISVQERPKKRPRSQLGRTVKNMAAYLIPGAALAVGVLTQLPEDFWRP